MNLNIILSTLLPILTHFLHLQSMSLTSQSQSYEPVFTDSLPKVNPLLSLPKTSIPRMFWNQLSKYSSPILLTSLIHSLSLCYTPRGDYRELASYLLTQCACLHQWKLIEQVLSWMKKNVPNSGLVFSNLLDLWGLVILSVRWMNIKELLSQKSALLVAFQNLPQFRCDDSLNVFQLLISVLKSLHSRDSLVTK